MDGVSFFYNTQLKCKGVTFNAVGKQQVVYLSFTNNLTLSCVGICAQFGLDWH